MRFRARYCWDGRLFEEPYVDYEITSDTSAIEMSLPMKGILPVSQTANESFAKEFTDGILNPCGPFLPATRFGLALVKIPELEDELAFLANL